MKLSARVEALDHFDCPMCGDTDFDVAGFVNHVNRYCDVVKAVDGLDRNEQIAAALKARNL